MKRKFKDKKAFAGLIVILVVLAGAYAGYFALVEYQPKEEVKEETASSASKPYIKAKNTPIADISFNETSTVYRCSSYYVEKQTFSVADLGNTIYDLKGNYITSCSGFKSYSSGIERDAAEKKCEQYPLTNSCILITK